MLKYLNFIYVFVVYTKTKYHTNGLIHLNQLLSSHSFEYEYASLFHKTRYSGLCEPQ